MTEQIDRINNDYQRDLERRERRFVETQKAIARADTDELMNAVAANHCLGSWGLVELLLDHGEGIIKDEWERVTPDGVPEPPDEFFMAIQIHLTPAYARALIARAGDVGRALLKEHAGEQLRRHYGKEVEL